MRGERKEEGGRRKERRMREDLNIPGRHLPHTGGAVSCTGAITETSVIFH